MADSHIPIDHDPTKNQNLVLPAAVVFCFNFTNKTSESIKIKESRRERVQSGGTVLKFEVIGLDGNSCSECCWVDRATMKKS